MINLSYHPFEKGKKKNHRRTGGWLNQDIWTFPPRWSSGVERKQKQGTREYSVACEFECSRVSIYPIKSTVIVQHVLCYNLISLLLFLVMNLST